VVSKKVGGGEIGQRGWEVMRKGLGSRERVGVKNVLRGVKSGEKTYGEESNRGF